MQRDPKDFAVSASHSLLKICLIITPALAAIMSVTSGFDRHPDEVHHFEAAKYYIDHSLPPEIGDPSVVNSYSVYGVSYLNYHWIEYFLAGKFIFLLSPVVSNQLIAARFFNVFLFFFFATFFIYRSRRDTDELLIPCFLLVTPQIWYLFSYVNNDAFALFVAFVVAYQIANSKSHLNRLFESGKVAGNAAGILIVGALLGVLLIVKTNYYAFLLFLGFWLLHKFPPLSRFGDRWKVDLVRVRKYVLLTLVALSILTFRCALDFYVNGETNFVGISYVSYFAGNFETKDSRLLRYQEKIATSAYKPSTIENDLANTDPPLKLKAKGTPFSEIFTKWRWHEISFQSFVGVYGYMTVFASNKFYLAMGLLYLAFAVYLVSVVLWKKRRRETLLQFGILLAGASVTAFISSYLSWSYAFQAQGRYLFPVIPMATVFVFANRALFDRLVINAFFLVAFLLSVYSFVFVGLPALAD